MVTIPLTISGIKEAQAQLKALGDEFDRLKDDPIESKRLAKEFNTLSSALYKTEQEFEKLNEQMGFTQGTFEEIYGKTLQPMTTQIGELEDRLYQLRLEGKENSEEFKAMTARVSDLRANIRETDRQIDLFAENRGLSVVSTGFRQIGESLLRLDFEGASRDAKALNSAMTGLGTRGAQAIKGLGSTVVQLGKTFAKMGVALLANPIFIMATVVTAVVGAIVALMNEMGVLQAVTEGASKVFEFFKGIIDTVVQALKDFTDWLGITNNAMKDLIKDNLKGLEDVVTRTQDVADSITMRYDEEIKLAQIAGKDTSKLELQKQEAVTQTDRIKLESYKRQLTALEALGDADQEQIQKIKDAIKETEKVIKQGESNVKVIKAQSDADEKKRREDQIKADRDAYKQRLADQKKFEQDRLNVARQIQDLELALLDEGITKEIEQNAVQYQRLIEDVQNNEALLQEEKERLTALYAEQQFEKEKEIRKKYDDDLQNALETANKAREEKAKADREKKIQDEKELAENILKIQQDQLNKQAEQEKVASEARVTLADNTIGALQGIETLLADSGVKTAGLQKTIALVQIAVDTAKAISSVVAGATAAAAAGGPAAPFLIAGYIASGIATVTSAIASARNALKSAPSIGGSVSGGGSPVSASVASPAQPSFELFGQNNNANNLGDTEDVTNSQNINVTALVSEVELTATQKKQQKLQESATL